MQIDEYFRSTITEARLYFALYKNFEQEVDDVYLKQGLVETLPIELPIEDMDYDRPENFPTH